MTEELQPLTPPRRRRRRVWVVLLVFAPLAAILLLVSAILFLPWIVTGERLRDEAVRALTETLGVPVEIEQFEYHLLTGFEVKGLRIGPPPGFERNVAEIARIAVHYDLSGLPDRVTVQEIIAVEPHFVVETIRQENGELLRNVDVIQKKLAEGKQPEEPKPSEPITGRVSPIDVTLDRLAVESLSLEMVGEGPRVKLIGLNLESDAKIDAKTLFARMQLAWIPAIGGENNLSVEIPATAADTEVVRAALRFAFDTKLEVSGGASDGIDLQKLELNVTSKLNGGVSRGAQALPDLDVEFGSRFLLEPTADRLELTHTVMSFKGHSLVDLSMSLEGLGAAMVDVLGAPAAELLMAQIGVDKKRADGLVHISVRTMELPFAPFEPYLTAFLPGMSFRGKVRLAPIEVEASALELLAGNPRSLSLHFAMEHLGVQLAEGPLSIADLDGAFDLTRKDPEGRYVLGGGLTGRNVRQATTTVAGFRLDLKGEMERLSPLLPGEAALGATFSADDIRVPKNYIHHVDAAFDLSGRELLAANRDSLEPIRAHAKLAIDRLKSGDEVMNTEVGGVVVDVVASLDRLLPTTQKPIAAEIKVAVDRVEQSTGTSLRGTKVAMNTTFTDPRLGTPIDAQLKMKLTQKSARAADATVENVEFVVSSQLEAVTQRVVPVLGPAPMMLPANVTFDVQLGLPSIALEHPTMGHVTTKMSASTNGSIDLVRQSVIVPRMAVDLDEVVKLRANLRATQVFAKEPHVEAKFELLPLDLGVALQKLPPSIVEQVGATTASGTMGMVVNVKGRVPSNFDNVDPTHLPIATDFKLSFNDVNVEMPARNAKVEGLKGTIDASAGLGKLHFGTNLDVGRISLEGARKEEIAGLTWRTSAGLRGEAWEVVSELDAESVSGSDATKGRPRIDVDLRHAKGGDLDLRRFDINLPNFGVEASIAGRLLRVTYGVLRPELVMKAKIDCDRMRTIVPEMGDISGVVAVGLDIVPESETIVALRGQLEVDHLTYRQPGMEMKNATGRIPVEQKLSLPKPIMRENIASAKGTFGDDLDRRIQEMSDDFMDAKLLFDSQDILVEVPRAADHQLLRPYVSPRGARMTIEKLVNGTVTLEAVTLEMLWRSGVLRFDRIAAGIFEGDVLADIAVQVTPDLDGRIRMRSTITELNVDIPYALVKNIAPVSDPKEKQAHRVSGTLDLGFELRSRTLNMKLDLTKLSRSVIERLLDTMDPKGEREAITSSKKALGQAEWLAGLRPSGGQFTVARNLFSMNVEFEQLWQHPDENVWYVVFMPWLLIAPYTFGRAVTGNVNGAFPDKVGIGYDIDQAVSGLHVEDYIETYLAGRVIAAEAPQDVARASF